MTRPESDSGIFDTHPQPNGKSEHDEDNGVPKTGSFEDTDRFSKVLYAAASNAPTSPDDFLDQLAQKLIQHGGGGGGGKPPPEYTKGERRNYNFKLALGLVGALSSGVGGTFLAVKSMAEENHRDVQTLKADHAEHEHEPMHREARTVVDDLKAQVGKIETVQQVQGRDIDYIKDGIDDLKEELRSNRRRRPGRGD